MNCILYERGLLVRLKTGKVVITGLPEILHFVFVGVIGEVEFK